MPSRAFDWQAPTVSNMICLQIFSLLVISTQFQAGVSLYEWNCSLPDENPGASYLIPDIGVDTSREAVATLLSLEESNDNDVIYIFPVPPVLNCSGIVSAMKFCYAVDSDVETEQSIFSLLILEQRNLSFLRMNSILVTSTPSERICTTINVFSLGRQYCCDTKQLGITERFLLPSPNFAFGILQPSDLLAYGNTSSFLVEHFRIPATRLLGNAITFSEEERQFDRGLRLIQFFITSAEPPATTAGAATVVPVLFGVAVWLLLMVLGVLLIRRKYRIARLNNAGTVRMNVANNSVMIVLSGKEIEGKSSEAEEDSKLQHRYDFCTSHTIPEDIVVSPTKWQSLIMHYMNYYTLIHHQYDTCISRIMSDERHIYEPTSYNDPTFGSEKPDYNDEDLYIPPGTDEPTLYSQLEEILTQDISRDAIVLRDLIGAGQFGNVYRGVWHSHTTREKEEVAVKTLKEGSGNQEKLWFLQEAAIMGQFKHPNVVTMYGVVTEGEPVLLVLELLSKGDLRSHLLHMKAHGNIPISSHALLSYCRQVASGMTYLSNKAFVHRDLAARNILVSEKGICKIADFGMSRDLMDDNYYVAHGGHQIPVRWTAPEALYYKKYSTASDVWSYGVLMYEIWSVGTKPYSDCSNQQILILMNGGYRLPPPPGCPRAVYSTMILCWHPLTFMRPSFTDISTNLSLPDTELLKWSEEDKSTHPGADKLGADLLLAQDLYRDLQDTYKEDES